MNKVTILPKENVTLLLVVVPKGYEFYIEDDLLSAYITGRNADGSEYLIWFNDIFDDSPETKEVDSVVGLLSNITEEQAKELGFKEGTDWRNEGIMAVPYPFSARNALIKKIESSGITIDKDQGCLILKVN